MTLDNLLVRGRNNLDFMRLVAAALVVVSHAYPLSRGPAFQQTEPLVLLTRGQFSFGALAVGTFFIISGFLITASFERSTRVRYLWSRVLRIFPALFVTYLLTIFLLGPLVTTLAPEEYLFHPLTLNYFRGLSLIDMRYFLPEVFVGNVNFGAVNGSLWTLRYEFALYLFTMVIRIGRHVRRYVVLVSFTGALLLLLFAQVDVSAWLAQNSPVSTLLASSSLEDLARLSSYFLAGSLAYLYRSRLQVSSVGALTALLVLALSAAFGVGLVMLFSVAGTYLVLYLGVIPGQLNAWGRIGDFSYGTYIYAFPIQQTLVFLSGGSMAVGLNILLALPLALACGAASWHLVEKRAIAWKGRRATLLKQLQASVRP